MSPNNSCLHCCIDYLPLFRKKKHARVKAYLIIQAVSMIAILVQVAFLAIAGRKILVIGHRELIRDQNIGIGILAANYAVFLGEFSST